MAKNEPAGEKTPEEKEAIARLQREKREVREIYRPYKRLERPVRYRIPTNRINEEIKNLASPVRDHIEQYKDILSAMFKNSDEPVIAFDVEEIMNEVINIMALLIRKDLSFEIYLDSSTKRPRPEETKVMMKRLVAWIKSKEGHPVILLHGFNKNERGVIAELEKKGKVLNTQTILKKAIEDGNDLGVEKENLNAFQKCIGFKPAACTFIKHAKEYPVLSQKTLALMWPQQAKICTTRVAEGKPVRTCIVCGRPQDIYLYCLEDSITTMLIYASFISEVT
ncbi:MAG: hypothetical protein ACTSUE_00880 [Promethearchaeota archaeon]